MAVYKALGGGWETRFEPDEAAEFDTPEPITAEEPFVEEPATPDDESPIEAPARGVAAAADPPTREPEADMPLPKAPTVAPEPDQPLPEAPAEAPAEAPQADMPLTGSAGRVALHQASVAGRRELTASRGLPCRAPGGEYVAPASRPRQPRASRARLPGSGTAPSVTSLPVPPR